MYWANINQLAEIDKLSAAVDTIILYDPFKWKHRPLYERKKLLTIQNIAFLFFQKSSRCQPQLDDWNQLDKFSVDATKNKYENRRLSLTMIYFHFPEGYLVQSLSLIDSRCFLPRTFPSIEAMVPLLHFAEEPLFQCKQPASMKLHHHTELPARTNSII